MLCFTKFVLVAQKFRNIATHLLMIFTYLLSLKITLYKKSWGVHLDEDLKADNNKKYSNKNQKYIKIT